MAALTRSNLTAFYPYPITAVYLGDAFNLSSSSSVLTQAVKQTTSTATITTSANPSTRGQGGHLRRQDHLADSHHNRPGHLRCGNHGAWNSSAQWGKAIFTTSTLPVGSTWFKVTYYGNSNITTSSAAVRQTVQ